MPAPLISTTTKVEAPHISVKIGNYTFGMYSRKNVTVEMNKKLYSAVKVTYPNYMQSLTVTKINGTLNQYVLSLVYPITQNDDPNMIDRILSSVVSSRKIVFTYGDCATPTYMYREEEGIITTVSESIDAANSKITYTINAVSTAINLTAGTYSFPKYSNKKPSDVIKQILFNKRYGLQDVFYGMHSESEVLQKGLIASDDRSVTIQAKSSITILDYLNYLVSCMSSFSDSTTAIKKAGRYVLTIHDDTSGLLDGPYFQVQKVLTSANSSSSIDYYTIDIGYPGKDMVTQFSVYNEQAYSILYDFSQNINQSDYVYRINDNGEMTEIYSPTLTSSHSLMLTTEADRTWWSQMTQFPIKATMTIKGLLRASILMSYIRVNVYFFGRKHTSSGIYAITKQEDKIDQNGYTTTLSLLRIGADDQQNS